MAALARALAAQRAPLVSLAFTTESTAGLVAARSELGRAGYRFLDQQLPPVPIVPIDGDWEGFLAGLDPKMLSNLRRRERRLGELGAVSVEVHDGTEGLPALLDEVLRLETSGWKLEGGSAIASRPTTIGFYTEMSRWAAARGILRISLLRCGDRAIACQLGIEDNGVYYFLKGGFDPEFAKYGPSRALVRATLASAFSKGLRCVDFVGGADPWKLEWTSATHDRAIVHAFAPGARGELERLVLTYGRPARAAFRRRLRETLRR
jgi:CelD/BcsL family acetyltransferase involved in cellulose biosynthesis